MFISKENKKNFYNWAVKLFKKINIEDKSLGFAIKAIHFNIPAFLMLFMVYGSKTLNIIIIAYLLIVLLLFFLFDGCFLTKIEKKIDGEDLTIIDPLLEFFKIDKTHENRFKNSIIIFFTYFTVILFIFYTRFFSNFESTNFFDNFFSLFISIFTSSESEK
jgi:hypothetical protein